MNLNNLVQAVQTVHGGSFVGIDTLTNVPLAGGKKNPMQGRVQKRTIGNSVMCFQNKNLNGYEEMVKRRLLKEGKNPQDFVLGDRLWGERLKDLPIVKHNKDGQDNFYLEVIFLHPGQTEYLLDGKHIDSADIIGLKQAVVNAQSQAGLNDKVVLRTFSCDSITEVRVNGQSFK